MSYTIKNTFKQLINTLEYTFHPKKHIQYLYPTFEIYHFSVKIIEYNR